MFVKPSHLADWWMIGTPSERDQYLIEYPVSTYKDAARRAVRWRTVLLTAIMMTALVISVISGSSLWHIGLLLLAVGVPGYLFGVRSPERRFEQEMADRTFIDQERLYSSQYNRALMVLVILCGNDQAGREFMERHKLLVDAYLIETRETVATRASCKGFEEEQAIEAAITRAAEKCHAKMLELDQSYQELIAYETEQRQLANTQAIELLDGYEP